MYRAEVLKIAACFYDIDMPLLRKINFVLYFA